MKFKKFRIKETGKIVAESSGWYWTMSDDKIEYSVGPDALRLLGLTLEPIEEEKLKRKKLYAHRLYSLSKGTCICYFEQKYDDGTHMPEFDIEVNALGR